MADIYEANPRLSQSPVNGINVTQELRTTYRNSQVSSIRTSQTD